MYRKMTMYFYSCCEGIWSTSDEKPQVCGFCDDKIKPYDIVHLKVEKKFDPKTNREREFVTGEWDNEND